MSRSVFRNQSRLRRTQFTKTVRHAILWEYTKIQGFNGSNYLKFSAAQMYQNSSTTAQGFIDGLHQVYSNIQNRFPPCGPQKTIAALNIALQNATAYGYVFVFTDRPASTNDTSLSQLLPLVDQLKPQVTRANICSFVFSQILRFISMHASPF